MKVKILPHGERAGGKYLPEAVAMWTSAGPLTCAICGEEIKPLTWHAYILRQITVHEGCLVRAVACRWKPDRRETDD